MASRSFLILALLCASAPGQTDEHVHPDAEPPMGVVRKLGADGEPCWYWQHNSFLNRIEMTYCGEISLTADRRAIAHVGPGGHLRIQQTTRLLDVGQPGAHRELVAVPGPTGSPLVTYLEDGQPAEHSDASREWRAEVLDLAFHEVLLGLGPHLDLLLDKHGVTVATDVVEGLQTAAAWAVMVDVLTARERTSADDWLELALRALDDEEGVWIVADVVQALAPRAAGNASLAAELIELGRGAGDEHDVSRALLAIVDHAQPTREQLRRILDLARRGLESEYLLTELLTRSMPRPLFDDEVGRAWLRAVGTLRSGFAAARHLREAAAAIQDGDLVRAWLDQVEDVPSPTRRYELLRDAPELAFDGRNFKRWVKSVSLLEDGEDQGELLTMGLHRAAGDSEKVEAVLEGADRRLGAERLAALLETVPVAVLAERGVVRAYREAASDLPEGAGRDAALARLP